MDIFHCVCMLSGFSHVQLCVTLWTIALQAPLSTGILQARILEWLPCPSPGYLPNPRIKPGSPTLQAISLLSKPPGKRKNTGLGNLSLLQGNFLTQEVNQRLISCIEGRFFTTSVTWQVQVMEPTPVFLPGESPWTEEPCGLQSTGSQKESDNTE